MSFYPVAFFFDLMMTYFNTSISQVTFPFCLFFSRAKSQDTIFKHTGYKASDVDFLLSSKFSLYVCFDHTLISLLCLYPFNRAILLVAHRKMEWELSFIYFLVLFSLSLHCSFSLSSFFIFILSLTQN